MCVVITFEANASVETAGLVLGNLIFSLQCCNEVAGILFLSVFDAKVIEKWG